MKVYRQPIRSVLEMAVPVWNTGLTIKEVRSLERVQKVAFAIMMGKGNIDYNETLIYFNSESLANRREKFCLNFAIKAFRSEKFNCWFKKNESSVDTRTHKVPLINIYARTTRFKSSPIPYMTRLLNKQEPSIG